jgi:hypothetical protein
VGIELFGAAGGTILVVHQLHPLGSGGGQVHACSMPERARRAKTPL